MASSNGSSSKYNLYETDESEENDVPIGKNIVNNNNTNNNSAGGELEEEIEEVNTKSELKVFMISSSIFFVITILTFFILYSFFS